MIVLISIVFGVIGFISFVSIIRYILMRFKKLEAKYHSLGTRIYKLEMKK